MVVSAGQRYTVCISAPAYPIHHGDLVGVGLDGVLRGGKIAVGDGVKVIVGVSVSVGVLVIVGVLDGVGVSDGVGVMVGVSDGVGVTLGVNVSVGVLDGVGVSDGVGLGPGVMVGVRATINVNASKSLVAVGVLVNSDVGAKPGPLIISGLPRSRKVISTACPRPPKDPCCCPL